jgi:hypothetical protein
VAAAGSGSIGIRAWNVPSPPTSLPDTCSALARQLARAAAPASRFQVPHSAVPLECCHTTSRSSRHTETEPWGGTPGNDYSRSTAQRLGGIAVEKSPSRPGESHPEPLTEPCVTVSDHTARATHRRLPPSAITAGSSCCQLTRPVTAWVTCPLPSTAITPLPRYYGAVRPWCAHRYFRPRGSSTCAFSLAIADQVLKFRTKAQIRVTPPEHRTSRDR